MASSSEQRDLSQTFAATHYAYRFVRPAHGDCNLSLEYEMHATIGLALPKKRFPWFKRSRAADPGQAGALFNV